MNPVDTLVEEAIAAGAFSGAALLFSQGNKVWHENYYGVTERGNEAQPITPKTHFDVSSLTKVMATTAIAMRLNEQGRLGLSMQLKSLLDVFTSSPYATVSVAELLAHRSGLPAYRPYYRQLTPPAVVRSFGRGPQDDRRKQYLGWIAGEVPSAPAGERFLYSDLGFIVLGAVLELLTQKTLRILLQEELVEPLRLTATTFGPLVALPVESVAATEQDPWRGRLLKGEVHDENAAALGGAAGHAGIFTTVTDCHIFAHEIIRAVQGKSAWLTKETVCRFIGGDFAWSLGWDRPSRLLSQAGRYLSKEAIGHLGYTGCSLWIEWRTATVVILFTNRVHPRRGNEQIKEFRPKIHNALFQYYLHS